MDTSPSPLAPQPSSPPQIIEQSTVSPTTQEFQAVAQSFPLKSALVVLAAIIPVLIGINMIVHIASNVKKQTIHQQALIDAGGDEDLLNVSPSPQAVASTYENPLDDSTQYENPFTVSAYSNPFSQ